MPPEVTVDKASERAKQNLGTLIMRCRGTLSQSQLAKRVGLPRSNMKYIEDGVNAPTAEVYDKLIKELKPDLQTRQRHDAARRCRSPQKDSPQGDSWEVRA